MLLLKYNTSFQNVRALLIIALQNVRALLIIALTFLRKSHHYHGFWSFCITTFKMTQREKNSVFGVGDFVLGWIKF